jgi:hypothetical protein
MSNDIRRAVIAEMSGWPGVEIDATNPDHPQFHVGRVELGHLHGDAVAHLPFPRRVRDALIERGEVTPHPMFPDAGWVERRISGPDEVAHVLQLFRMNHDRAMSRAAGEHAAGVAKNEEQAGA